VPEEQVDPQQEDTSVSPEASSQETPVPLMPSILKAEIQSVFDYISEYRFVQREKSFDAFAVLSYPAPRRLQRGVLRGLNTLAGL